MNTSKPTGGENPPTKEPQVKPKYNKMVHTNRRKINPRASRLGDQRDHTTETHRTPTIEVHPTKTASKAQNQELLKQTKKVT